MKVNKQQLQNFMRNRIRNKYLWMAVIALLINLGLSGFIVLPANFEETATALLNVLVLLGIFNNPSTESQAFFVDENGNGIDDRYEVATQEKIETQG